MPSLSHIVQIYAALKSSFVANLFGKFVFVEAPVTVNHIMTHAFQFRIGFVINLFSVVFFLLAAWALYVLLKPVNKDLALLFLIFNLAGFTVWLFSSLCLFASLVILNGSGTLKAFQPDQLQALAVFFVNVYKNGVFMAQVPYGVWLFPLGYLVLKSRFLPKIQQALDNKKLKGQLYIPPQWESGKSLSLPTRRLSLPRQLGRTHFSRLLLIESFYFSPFLDLIYF